jgi:Xaa-Pro aminopeptidase
MTLSRRDLIRTIGLGLAAAGAAAENLACSAEPQSTTGGSDRLLVTRPGQPEPAPVGYDRLPIGWYKDATRRLKEKVKALGVDAILLQNDHNLVYFTGCFRESGDRTTWALFPVDEADTVYWYSPGIDRDLIESWWCSANEYYFCYLHAEGGFPNKGQVVAGRTVDLFEWMLAGLARRGLAGKTIGVDVPPSPARQASIQRILPRTKVVDVGRTCLDMRIRKTREEIALTQRAYRYFDRIHAFARDFILEHGTNTTDFEIGQALKVYGIQLMMRDVKRDGRPHTAVGIDVTSQYVRTGVATGYPHPNQFFSSKVEPGDALYVNTDILLGGYGGECYRNFAIAPWTAPHEKLWQVVADTVQIMVEETRPGRACSDVAFKVHDYQVKSGMAEHIYHRPGHGCGQNFEGHQPPFLSLGDHSAIEEGMVFSVEPGLYDTEQGIGVNPSDKLLVTKTGAVLMSRVPFSREWSFLKPQVGARGGARPATAAVAFARGAGR